MKEHYLGQVKRNLHLPRKAKMEVLRDVEEAFASALEHGETEAQVIERLGSPEAFAKGVEEQLGVPPVKKRGWKKRLVLTGSVLLCAAAFSAAFLVRAAMPDPNLIGQADAMTTIRIAGSGIDTFGILIGLGCAALLPAIWLVVRSIRHKR